MRPLSVVLAALLFTAAVQGQTLFNFESPAQPQSSLVDGGDGFYYGTTVRGGSAGKGEVYKIDLATGQRTTVATFNGANGAYPLGDVVFKDQFIYGTTYQGGASDSGTVFKVDRSTGALTTLATLDQINAPKGGTFPRAGLIFFGSDLYGTTSEGGAGNSGAIFKVNPSTGLLTIVASFNTSSNFPPSHPYSSLVAVGSFLYGVSHESLGGGPGFVFKLDPATGTLSSLGDYSSVGGFGNAGLIAAGPFLYGTAALGATGPGYLFKVDPATGSVTTIYTFNGGDGGPTGGLVSDGTYLYGTTARTVSTLGTIFRFDPSSGQVTTLASFPDVSKGSTLLTALLLKDGALFGTASLGGPNNGGSIFKVDLSTLELTAVNFFNDGNAGATPSSPLMIDGRTLYGTTYEAGARGLGTVFKMDLSSGQFDTLATFNFRSGGNTTAGLVAKDGILYGTTQTNGVNSQNKFTNNGTIFSVDPSTGTLATVFAFDIADKNIGAVPIGGLALAGSSLYGTTSTGIGGLAGTVFRLDLATGAMTGIHAFTSPFTTGSTPRASLVPSGSFLYGTTYQGGSLGRGTVFRIDPADGTFTSLASVVGSSSPNPNSALTPLGSYLYGATPLTIYKFDPASGTVTTVAAFDITHGELVGNGLATDGKSLFGTTSGGGAFGHGKVFQLDPVKGTITTLLSFDGTNGDSPFGGVLVDGPYLYGTTRYGGAKGGGTLFRLAIPRPRTRAVGKP